MCVSCLCRHSASVTPACVTVLGPGQTASWHLKDGGLQPNNLVNWLKLSSSHGQGPWFDPSRLRRYSLSAKVPLPYYLQHPQLC